MRTKPVPNLVSILVPVYNEAGNLPRLFEEIEAAMTDIGSYTYEVVWVDDHSTDDSHRLLQQVAAVSKKHRVYRLQRNMGQPQALAAALSKSRGEIVVTIDSDLQNPPHEIPRILREMDAGWDVVSGWRRQRKDKLIRRRLPSWAANWLISKVLGFRVHDLGCSLKGYRRKFLANIQFIGDTHRFLLAYAVFNGARYKEIEVEHRPRYSGQTKYGFSRIPKVLIDIVLMQFFFKYSTRPAHFFGYYSFLLLLTASLLSVFVVVRYFYTQVWMTPLLIVSIVAFFAGIIVLFLALALDILYRLSLTQSGGALFVLEEDETGQG